MNEHYPQSARSKERTRYWSLEESIQATAITVQGTPELRQTVFQLSGGRPGIMRAIQECVADEVSYDPAEAITSERIRNLVGAPEDEASLANWRDDFYAPYREKYHAEMHPHTQQS